MMQLCVTSPDWAMNTNIDEHPTDHLDKQISGPEESAKSKGQSHQENRNFCMLGHDWQIKKIDKVVHRA